jgi:hypothetical protein
MSSSDNHRTQAFLSALAGVLFLVVAIFGRENWDWRSVLALIAGVSYIIISIQQFRIAKKS